MSRLRRISATNSTFFLTSVTYERRPILAQYAFRLRDSATTVCRHLSADLIAWVILPDHFHILVDSPRADASMLMKAIKQSFSMNYRKLSKSRGRVWQLRFWDHIIRDQEDLRRHFDYIHFNPVKHGLTRSPFHYEYSTAISYLQSGHYQEDWGEIEPELKDADFGE